MGPTIMKSSGDIGLMLARVSVALRAISSGGIIRSRLTSLKPWYSLSSSMNGLVKMPKSQKTVNLAVSALY